MSPSASFTQRLDIVPYANGSVFLLNPKTNKNNTHTLQEYLPVSVEISDGSIGKDLEKVLYLKATVAIAVYVTQTTFDETSSEDTILALPVEWTATSYRYVSLSNQNLYFSSSVLAIEDNTMLSVSLQNGTTVEKILQKFEVYIFDFELSLEVINLNSSKRVTLFSALYCISGFKCGFQILQHSASYLHGEKFILPSLLTLSHDANVTSGLYRFAVLSEEEDKFVCIDSSRWHYCNDTLTYSLLVSIEPAPESASVVYADGPAEVTQLLGSVTDAVSCHMPSLSQFLDQYHFVIPDTYSKMKNYISISILKSEVNNLMIDGLALNNPEFTQDVPQPFSDYVILWFSISTGYHRLYNKNGVPFGVLCVGSDEGIKYCYLPGLQVLQKGKKHCTS